MLYLNTSLDPQNGDPSPRHRGRRVRRPRPILVGGRHRADVDVEPSFDPDPELVANAEGNDRVLRGDRVAVGREAQKALDAYRRAGGR